MTIASVTRDLDALTLTLVAEYDAAPDRVWELWADPRKLERWWGPPVYPATVVAHDLTRDGTVSYYMTGPEGDRHWGWWRIVSVEPPRLTRLRGRVRRRDGRPRPEPARHGGAGAHRGARGRRLADGPRVGVPVARDDGPGARDGGGGGHAPRAGADGRGPRRGGGVRRPAIATPHSPLGSRPQGRATSTSGS